MHSIPRAPRPIGVVLVIAAAVVFVGTLLGNASAFSAPAPSVTHSPCAGSTTYVGPLAPCGR